MALAPVATSSDDCHASLTVPQSSSFISFRMCAAVSSIDMWQSWPHACITPFVLDAKGSPVSSVTDRASISPLSSTVLPGFAPLIVAKVEVSRPQCSHSTPILSSSSLIFFAVSYSFSLTSALLWNQRLIST